MPINNGTQEVVSISEKERKTQVMKFLTSLLAQAKLAFLKTNG